MDETRVNKEELADFGLDDVREGDMIELHIVARVGPGAGDMLTITPVEIFDATKVEEMPVPEPEAVTEEEVAVPEVPPGPKAAPRPRPVPPLTPPPAAPGPGRLPGRPGRLPGGPV